MSVKIKCCVNVDADEFLNDFLELQDQACGPTVDEFMQALHIPTYALFGLTNEDLDYTEQEWLKLSKTEKDEFLDSLLEDGLNNVLDASFCVEGEED